MKKFFIVSIISVLLTASAVYAADINVKVNTDNRVLMNTPINNPDYGFYYNQNSILLKAQQSADNIKGYAEVEMMNRNIPLVSNLAESVLYDKVQPFELLTKEAYVKFFGLFYEGLDLTVGRQVVAWGTADRLNQTSFVNPYDFYDPLNFGERLGVNSARVNLAFGDFGIDMVYVPVFSPSVMPGIIDTDAAVKAGIADGITAQTGMPVTGVIYGSSVDVPEAKAENSEYAAKVGGNIAGFDMSASYFYGFYNAPVNAVDVNVEITGSGCDIDGFLTQKYVKINSVGYDIAGSVLGMGVRGEAAAIVPDEKVTQTTIVTTPLGSDVSETILLDKKAYFKYTLGCDYTFSDSTYINLQFMHGFFTELGDNMSDIMIGRVEKGFLDDKFKVKIEGGFEFEFNKDKNLTPGALLMPGIIYSPSDATEIELTGLKVFANNKNDEKSHFIDSFDGFDQLILRASYTF